MSSVPGGNLLKKAFKVISKDSFIYRQFKSRTTNGIGIDIPEFEPDVTLKGSIQAVPRRLYQQHGLDWKKNYITIYSSNEGDKTLIGTPDGIELVTNGDCETAKPTMNGKAYSVFRLDTELSTEQAYAGASSLKCTKNDIASLADLHFSGGASLGLIAGNTYEQDLKIYVPASVQSGTVLFVGIRYGNVTNVLYFESSDFERDAWLTFPYQFIDDDMDRILYAGIKDNTSDTDAFYIDNMSVQKIEYDSSAPPVIEGVNRDTSGDRIIFNGKLFQVLDENNWTPVDGWNGVMCVEISQ